MDNIACLNTLKQGVNLWRRVLEQKRDENIEN
jgi:hypothetical protein